MSKSRAIFLFLTIVAVVLVSAVGTTSVYADDGTPPPPATETAVVDPSTGADQPPATEPAEAAPTSEPVAAEPTSEPVVAEPSEAAPTEAPAEAAPVVEEQQPAAPEAEATSVLEQVPTNTEVTVLNAEGEAQPLTSQESAEAIATTSDPIWCPGDALPGNENCTAPFSSFTALLSFLKAHEAEDAYKQPGTIFVEMGNYGGGESSIDFSSYNFANFNQYDLTVQGGWNTETNETPDPSDLSAPNTKFTVPITVAGSSSNPWVGSLTFNNIWIDGVINHTGLTLVTEGSINLNSVQVTNSQAGADLTAGGKVEVKNSNFNKNTSHKTDGFGLKIKSTGKTILDTVNANNNETFGADIEAGGTVKIINSVFSGNISYTNCPKTCYTQPCKETANGGYGLKVVSTYAGTDWAVKLDGVTANNNYLFGAYIESADAKILNSNFNENKSTGAGEPLGYGLKVKASGGNGVTLANVHADKNQLFGADITAGDKDIAISNSFFNGNQAYYKTCSYKARSCNDYVCEENYYGYGLNAVSTGVVTLNTVEAQNNYLLGAHLEGSLVAIAYGTFNSNGSDAHTGKGLEITSTTGVGNVTLSDVTASHNQEFGANIKAVGEVVIANSEFSGQVIYSYSGNCSQEDMKGCYSQPCVKKLVGGGYGLQVVTDGPITAAGVYASDNYLFGTRLVGKTVKIAGYRDPNTGEIKSSSFERNKEGLKIEAQGYVLIDNVIANANTLSGATILAGLDKLADGSVTISNSFFNGNSSYTYSSCKGKTFEGYGLRIVTTGDLVSLTGVEANDNYLYGAYIEGGVIDISESTFNSNGTDNRSDHVGKGLDVVSSEGKVTLAGVEANDNQLYGANIQAKGNVVVRDSMFSGNYSSYRDCSGKTSTSTVVNSGPAIGGSSKGCQSNNCKDVYDGYGLKVVTTGDIFVGNVVAENNYLYGAHLEGANVDIYDSSFSSNASPTPAGQTPTGRGLEVKSSGNTTLSGVTASKNQLFGASIEAGGNVTINSSFFSSNTYSTSTVCKKTTAGYGLKVVATGTINLGSAESPDTGIKAETNGAEGAILNGQSTVTVVDSFFNSNGANGLTVTANDLVTLTNVTASGNKGNGAEVTGTCTSVVKVDGGAFENNGKYGLKVVKATYEEGATAPSFSGNGSGGLFQDSSTCVSSGGTGTGSGSTGGGNTGSGNHGGHGWNWYWWWFWHGFGHHH